MSNNEVTQQTPHQATHQEMYEQAWAEPWKYLDAFTRKGEYCPNHPFKYYEMDFALIILRFCPKNVHLEPPERVRLPPTKYDYELSWS